VTQSLTDLRKAFHEEVCKRLLTVSAKGIPSNADGSQKTSVEIAKQIAAKLGAQPGKKLAGQTAGAVFEGAVTGFTKNVFAQLGHLRPGDWSIEAISSRKQLVIGRYEQYSHLIQVQKIAEQNPDLAVFVGNDYSVASDVVVSRLPLEDETLEKGGLVFDDQSARHTPLRLRNNQTPIMHATISCKWTIRSDRAQNSRFEALNLLRSRKGRVPHIVVVTGEPTPTRLASLALGTGDIDCVYHFALNELIDAVEALGQPKNIKLLRNMVEGNRLRDISDLPFDLAL
jgi:hypothetical protein